MLRIRVFPLIKGCVKYDDGFRKARAGLAVKHDYELSCIATIIACCVTHLYCNNSIWHSQTSSMSRRDILRVEQNIIISNNVPSERFMQNLDYTMRSDGTLKSQTTISDS